MNRQFKTWFARERARALATVLLTRRDELTVEDGRPDSGLDFTVSVSHGNRPFGVAVAATISPVAPEAVARIVQPAVRAVQTAGAFHFPVCIFFFTVKNDQGCYAWVYEPRLTSAGEPRLAVHHGAHCQPLDDAALETILASVNQWYDAFDAKISLPMAESAPHSALASLPGK